MTDNAIINRICASIRAGRFDWRKYQSSKLYCGRTICTQQMLCSYGLIGFVVGFPFSDLSEITYDWEWDILRVGEEERKP